MASGNVPQGDTFYFSSLRIFQSLYFYLRKECQYFCHLCRRSDQVTNMLTRIILAFSYLHDDGFLWYSSLLLCNYREKQNKRHLKDK